MPIKDYKARLNSYWKNIEESDEILQENKETLRDFERDQKLNDLSLARIYKLITYLAPISKQLDVPFEEATEDDIKNILEWVQDKDASYATVRDYKVILKKFYKWLNGGNYPDKVDWIDTTKKQRNNKLPEKMFSEEDIDKLIKAAENPRDKAFISLLWETGARIGELIDLKVESIEDRKNGKKVVIDGKTGARRLPLVSSVPHVQNWLNNHPEKDDPKAPLWCKLTGEKAGEEVSYRYLRKMLNKMGEKVKIDKPTNPHHFRHSRATYLATRFKEAQMCEWFGWVQGSDRPADYVHLSGRDIDLSYDRLHGIEDEEEPEKSKLSPEDCPRCGAKNDPNASFCQNCGQALSQEAFEEIEKKEEKAGPVMSELGISEDEAEKVIKAAEKILESRSEKK